MEKEIFTYNIIESPSEGLYKEKGSKFLAFAYPVADETEILNHLDRINKHYHDARHRCYAYRLGIEESRTKTNDDGEPTHTAGKPILGQIEAFQVTNIIIFVVRYFGGTLLGKGGLIRAYKSAAQDALQNATIKSKTIDEVYQLHFSYDNLDEIMKILDKYKLKPIETQFGETCTAKYKVPRNKAIHIKDLFKPFPNCHVQYLYTE